MASWAQRVLRLTSNMSSMAEKSVKEWSVHRLTLAQDIRLPSQVHADSGDGANAHIVTDTGHLRAPDGAPHYLDTPSQCPSAAAKARLPSAFRGSGVRKLTWLQ